MENKTYSLKSTSGAKFGTGKPSFAAIDIGFANMEPGP